ncbi:DMT family transporter [Paenibacillus sp. LHD-38]|uniref:DMT family transporter n=1 Tax=Paenibacillus sp. LHD-38 TaxID=3072143 RepID=UPI00280F3881|nr:DMT family transporter [Paenibacillus sp. LHD-38]MDQ8733880.1 DMT family transporter [Paenibacillus sp. LHD-38]
MLVISIILVLCSGLAHAVWNMLAKQSTDKAVFLWVIYMPATILLLPTLVNELAGASLSLAMWLLIGASLIMQSIYSLLLAYTYNAGDLSQVYPVMRGTPTLLIPAFGVILFDEVLALWGWIGLCFMLTGFVVMLGRSSGKGQQASLKPMLLAMSVGLCITIYTLIDKANLQHLSPLALLEVTNIGFVLGLTPAVVHSNRLRHVIRTHSNRIWIGAILSPGSYLLFLFAARNANVSTVAPMREVGIVFGTLLGLFVLKESQGIRRITASVAVVMGIIMIASSGH